MKVKEIESGDHKVKLCAYFTESPDKIILCMHGFNGDLWGDGFSKFKKRLSDEDKIMVCSFDSAGHGESEVKSIDVTLDIVIQEIADVVNYLAKEYKGVPLYFFAGSYGGYRAMVSVARNKFENLKGIILINPAVKMLKSLEKIKNFHYEELTETSVVPMKASLNKYLSKKFIDDLYNNDLFKVTYQTKVPIKLIIGKDDDLISKQDLKNFAKMTNCEVEFIDDEHCIRKEESWDRFVEIIKSFIILNQNFKARLLPCFFIA